MQRTKSSNIMLLTFNTYFEALYSPDSLSSDCWAISNVFKFYLDLLNLHLNG